MLPEVKNQAIDLLIEDVYSINIPTRTRAKQLGCEIELDLLRKQLVSFLQSLK